MPLREAVPASDDEVHAAAMAAGAGGGGGHLPGLPSQKAPEGTRLDTDAYRASLRTKPTRGKKPHDLWEIEKTGPGNFLLQGGGEEFWADGVAGTEIHEAKYVKDPKDSPFIDGSDAPDFIRALIEQEIDDEFFRMAAIIGDASNPLESVTVIVNNPAANHYFLRMLEKHGLQGKVINE